MSKEKKSIDNKVDNKKTEIKKKSSYSKKKKGKKI